jgi:hypothetical protein
MSDTTQTKMRLTSTWWLLVAFVLAFDIAFLFQRVTGAYESEFGAHPDEAAHYVTGLFVRDAVTTLPGCIAQKSIVPLKAFGPDAPGGFYAHYPKVALGVWPPGFYAVQTAWTLPFGVSRTSVMLLMATLAASIALLIFRFVRREFGLVPAIVAGTLWLALPLARLHYSMVMGEILSTLCMFSAAILWGRYLDAFRARDAVYFALLASLAILTKGTGLALALMVIFSLLLSRKWSVLSMRYTWIAAAMVAIIAGPWTWYFRKAGTQVGGWADNSGGLSVSFTLEAIPYYLRNLGLAVGIAVAAFSLIGMIARSLDRGPNSGRWSSQTALVFAVFIFQCILPVGHEARHIISATPSIVVLAIEGIARVASLPGFRASESSGQPRRIAAFSLILAVLSVPTIALTSVQKSCGGFVPIAEWLMSQPKKSRVLVCSDSEGEGMFISEIAMRDKRPGFSIERGSKSLVDPKGRTWEGAGLKPKFDDTALLEYLRSGKIEFIVLDSAVPEKRRTDYHDQLNRVIDQNSSSFWKVLESPIVRDGEPMHRPLTLFRVKDAQQLLMK